MITRIVVVALAVLLGAILLVGRSQRRELESTPEDAGPPPSLARDVESARTEAVGDGEPGPEIYAVEDAFRTYMSLENRPQLGDLYADDAAIYVTRKTGDRDDDLSTRHEHCSGRDLKAFLNGTGPSPIVEEEPEYSTWSDISYWLRSDGAVSVSATRHASGYATPHELIFTPFDGVWLITQEERTRRGPWRRVDGREEREAPEEPEAPQEPQDPIDRLLPG